jgi:hypothetical protein
MTGNHPHRSALGLPRTLATACAILIAAITCWAFWTAATRPLNLDFVSFWSAGRLVLEGAPGAAYDLAAHHNIETRVVPQIGILPFPYPPPFLAAVTPFALLPFAAAFILWVLLTGGFYLLSTRRLAALPYLLANPIILVDAMIGQTGLLTAGLIICGLILLPASPFAGGALLGLMIMKPQLAVMLPVALLAARQWRAIAGALLSSIAALLFAFLLFGPGVYEGFFHMLGRYAGYLQQARWNWIELASPFAFARYFGVGSGAALSLQVLTGAVAAAMTWLAWSRNWEEKVAILASATLLASPYLFTYDAVLLVVPAAQLIARQQFWSAGLIWLLAALPVAHVFNLYQGPNTIWLASTASIVMLRFQYWESIALVPARNSIRGNG